MSDAQCPSLCPLRHLGRNDASSAVLETPAGNHSEGMISPTKHTWRKKASNGSSLILPLRLFA